MGLSSLNPAFGFAKVLSQLTRAGARLGGIACVTAHAPRILDRIHALLGPDPALKLLSMVEELKREVQTREYYRVGVLSTLGTHQSGIFGPTFAQATGADLLVLPAKSQREAIHQAIYKIKGSSQQVPEAAREIILEGVEKLRSQGVDAILLGCTELPLALPESHWHGTPLIDPLRVLARALLREAGAKARPESQLERSDSPCSL